MTYTIEKVTTLIGARRYGETDANIGFLLTDSRSLCFPEETLFFAIKSDRNINISLASTAVVSATSLSPMCRRAMTSSIPVPTSFVSSIPVRPCSVLPSAIVTSSTSLSSASPAPMARPLSRSGSIRCSLPTTMSPARHVATTRRLVSLSRYGSSTSRQR